MSRSDTLSPWTRCVSTNMPHRTTSQARLLAWWRFGIAQTRSCGRLTGATCFAMILLRKVDHLDQRLDAWCRDAADKAGEKRQSVEVTTCCVPRLASIIRVWHGTPLAVTVDARSLGDRVVVLTVSGV